MDKHLHKTSDKIRAGIHYRICVCFAIYYLDLREFFSYLLQSTHLNVSVFFVFKFRLFQQFWHSYLWSPCPRLSTRLDNELYMNLTLSINFILHITVFPFSFFCYLLQRMLCTSVFSLRHSE